jgi:organic hydroperoxide reductase OsmC/OhrA
MQDAHRFRVTAWWAAGRTGIAQASSAPNAIHFAAPPAFGGLEGRWSPEDLLLCAVASCYTTTFETLAEKSKLPYTDLQVEVEGEVVKTDAGYSLREIFMRATLILPQKQEQALDLLQKTHALCLVSRALSVMPRFEARVQIGDPQVQIRNLLTTHP